MALLDMQRAFARLLTDAEFRKQYLASATDALHGYALTPSEADALSKTDFMRLDRYAAMVSCKRLDLALEAIPRVRKMLDAGFLARYSEEYALRYPPVPSPGESPMLAEFRRAIRFLEEIVIRGDITVPQVLDVLRFESAFFLVGCDPAVAQSTQRFETDYAFPDEITGSTSLLRSPGAVVGTFHRAVWETAVSPNDGAQTVLLQKRPGDLRVRVTKLPATLKRLIETCDGQTPIREIAHQLCEEFKTRENPESTKRCIQASKTLVDRRVLGAVRSHPQLNRDKEVDVLCVE